MTILAVIAILFVLYLTHKNMWGIELVTQFEEPKTIAAYFSFNEPKIKILVQQGCTLLRVPSAKYRCIRYVLRVRDDNYCAVLQVKNDNIVISPE